LKNVWELDVMQQMLSSKGLAALTQRSLIFIEWLSQFHYYYCYEVLIVENDFSCILIVAHSNWFGIFFKSPTREKGWEFLRQTTEISSCIWSPIWASFFLFAVCYHKCFFFFGYN
jgi:hypothetical protein